MMGVGRCGGSPGLARLVRRGKQQSQWRLGSGRYSLSTAEATVGPDANSLQGQDPSLPTRHRVEAPGEWRTALLEEETGPLGPRSEAGPLLTAFLSVCRGFPGATEAADPGGPQSPHVARPMKCG